MSGHGHENCPNCEMDLDGMEPVCPQCEGDLYGIPVKGATKREKALEIAKKIEVEAKEAMDNVTAATTQTMKKVSEKIGDHQIPVFSNVKQKGEETVEKIRGSVSKIREKSTPEDESDLGSAAAMWQDELDSEEETTSVGDQSQDVMDIDEMLDKGEMLVAEGREQQALKLFNQVIAEDPGNGMAWFNRGIVHEMSGQIDDAKKAFKVCIDMQSDHGPAAANLAVLLERDGDISQAAKMARLALNAFPSHGDLTRIASLSPESADEQAVKETPPPVAEPEPTPAPAPAPAPVATVAPEPAPTPEPAPQPQVAPQPALDIDAIVEEAANLVKQDKAEDALELLRDLLHNEAAEHPRAWRIAAASMARLSLTDSAIEAFTYALDLDNSDAASWFNLGALHRRNGHDEAAITCYNAALSLKPDYTKASATLAEIHTESGDLVAAIDAWRSLLEVEPTHPGSTTFAEILVAIGEGEGEVLEMATELPTTMPEGPELASEAMKYIPDNGVSSNVMLKARALTLTGAYPEAVKAWRSLVEHDRENPDLWTGMMKTFIAAGDRATAEKCRQKIHSLTGSSPEMETVSESTPEPVSTPEPEPAPEPAPSEPQESAKPAGAVNLFATPETAAEEPQVEETAPVAEALSIDEPVSEAAVESAPEPAVEEDSGDTWGDDPWGDDAWGEPEDKAAPSTEESEASEVAAAEITAAEAVLETVSEPEVELAVHSSPEVDLAKAALDAQSVAAAGADSSSVGQVDSSSVANQDVQWYNKGLTLLADEKYTEALACFDKALPSFLNDDEMVVRILNARGNAFYYLKNFKDCIDSYIKAQKVDPSRVTGATLYNMGTAYAEVERYDDAIKCFEYAMSKKRVSPLEGDHAKMAKEQIRRCKLLHKEQQKKLNRLAKLQS